MSETYLEYHGTSICDPKDRKILDNAIFDGFKIEKNNLMNDGSFDKSVFGARFYSFHYIPSKFIHNVKGNQN